jgi:hypothetical protein
LEFNIDILILDLPLFFQTFLQKNFSCITDPLEIEPIEHSAYAFCDSLLLMIDFVIDYSTSLHLLQLGLGCESLQSEEKGLEKAEIVRPLECLCK